MPHALYRFGSFVLDTGREALLAQGTEVQLRAKSFALLRLMVENAGQLLSRAKIMETIWPNIHVTDDNITQCIHDIRDALGCESRHLLRTVPRRGYIFNAAVARQESNFAQVVAVDEPPRPRASSIGTGSNIDRAVRLSVLVVPLHTRDGCEAHERVAAHITADIVTDLVGYLRSLAPVEAQVLLHDAREAYQQATLDEGQADYLLRGTVQLAAGTSVNLQLIRRASGLIVWADRSEHYGPGARTAPMVQEIAAALLRDVGRRLDALPTQSLTARDLLLQGRAWLLLPASVGNRSRALHCFERAIATEPELVEAKLWKAFALVANLTNGWSGSIEQDEARVECLLQDVPEVSVIGAGARAHSVKGVLRRLQGRLDESRVELEMAIELAPRHAMAASQLGMTLLYAGRPNEAMQWFERGVRVAPQDHEMPLLLNNLGTGRVLSGDVDKGIDLLLSAAAGIPEHSSPPLMLAAAFGLNSESTAASAALRRAVHLCPALGTLSRLRSWMRRQGGPDFMPLYQHEIEPGLRRAGMHEE
ncbi:MAG TPA: winged helix-turn-helix domain-containing protein [Acetobacteraceae bacterium]|nr:winged helix-turn-helix domain-containing protein [Acetobacteraceae bacterium]